MSLLLSFPSLCICYIVISSLLFSLFLQSTYHTNVLLYPQACLPLLFSSWIQQSFTIFTSEAPDPAFSIANSLSSVKATSVITISGKENGRVCYVPDWTVQMERKYRNDLHTHTVHRPYVYSWHEEGSVNAVSSSEHTAAAFRGISQVAEAFFRF